MGGYLGNWLRGRRGVPSGACVGQGGVFGKEGEQPSICEWMATLGRGSEQRLDDEVWA